MNEMTLLGEMRTELAERDPDELTGARARLHTAMTAPATAPPSLRPRPVVRLAVASVVAVALAGGAAVGLGGQHLLGGGDSLGGGSNGPAGQTAAPADSAAIRLAAAVSATASTTFRFRIGGTLFRRPDNKTREFDFVIPLTGAYDPSGPEGYLQTDEGNGRLMEVRLVNHHLYRLLTKDGKVIAIYSDVAGATSLRIFGPTGVVAPVPDPGQVLAQLEQEGTVTDLGRSGTGADAVQHYQVVTTTGTIDVDVWVASSMVSRITVNGPERARLVMEYFDYGVPVNVQVPRLG